MKQEEQQLARWGWNNAPDSIVQLASDAVKVRGDVALALATLAGLDDATVERLSTRKPPELGLLEFAAQEYPVKVQPAVEMVHAMVNGFPFYGRLNVLGQHQAMTDPAVVKRCEELDCVLMLIESERAVLVFATFKAMLQYSMAGRAERTDDPLLAANGGELPLLAVGARDDIIVLNSQASKRQGVFSSDSVHVWHSASDETKASSAQRELARLLDHAIDNDASDIALAPQRDGSYRVLMRKWGFLVEPKTASTWNAQIANEIVNVLLAKSGANPSNTNFREPRDGQISYRSPVGDAFLRLSFIPQNHMGEIKARPSVSLRLFSHSEAKIDLDSLGLEPEVVRAIDDAVRLSHGLILVSGPMNSGKSTTIAGALGRHVDLYGSTRKRVSVEQPIERYIADVSQFNVPMSMNDQNGNRVDDDEMWDRILRGLKRHDVNTFWIGEVRDRQTGDFCVITATAGHLGMTTIHANDSVLAVDTLSQHIRPDLRYQLAEAMVLSISQRLVPALCSHCKTVSKTTADDRRRWQAYMERIGEDIKLPGMLARARPEKDGHKCPHCDNGYRGYAVMSEVLPFTRAVKDQIGELIERRPGAAAARAALREARTLTLGSCGERHLAAKRVDLASVIV